MVGEWRTTTLGQVTDFLSGGTPSKEALQYWRGSIPWVSAKDMKRFRLDDTQDHVTEDGLANGTKLIPSGTVLLLARGMTLLNDLPICVVNRPMTFNQDVKALRPKPGVRDEFLPYLLLGNKDRLLNLVDLAGHGTGRLNSDELKAFDVVLPPEAEQRAIAHILGTLDDKIELNRRMNESLEAMAQVLFKSWFVDFDPVRAKVEGRDHGLSKPFADLFPDSFEDSDLGEIPKGWPVGSFGEVISQRTERIGGREAVVLSAVAVGELVKSDEHFTKRVYSKEINKYIAVERWDFAYNPSRINIGSIGMLKEPLIGAVSPVYVVFRPKPAYRWFIEFTLERESTKQWINTLASGSVRQSLSYSDFQSISCVVPPKEVIEQFNHSWRVLRDGILVRSAESSTLTALRDALLPRLISGELRIEDAERMLGGSS